MAHLLGASIRIGAVIPRYSLEALPDISSYVRAHRGLCSAVPLMLDDLPEAVDHTIVPLVTHGLAGLELSMWV
jgi:hypothetical protein